MSGDSELFRKKALEKYLRVDAPGALLTITPPLTVAVFGTMAALFVGVIALGVFGRAQMTAEGPGIVKPDLPPIVLRAPFTGTILSVGPALHASGKAGETLITLDARTESAASIRCSADLASEQAELATLEKRLDDWEKTTGKDHDAQSALVILGQIRNARDKATEDSRRCEAVTSVVAKSVLTFPVDATVEDLAVSAGAQIHEGDVLATLAPANPRMVGYLALGERYRSEVREGMAVRVKFDALPYDEVGVGDAHVVRLTDALPSGVKIEGAPRTGVYAELSLDAMPAGSGPPRSGMTFTGDVLTRRQAVLALLFDGSP